MANPERLSLFVCLSLLTLVAACSSGPVGDSGPAVDIPVSRLPDDPVPKKEPRSRYGNGPSYEVYGKTYRVLNTSYGYQERGVASWYGRKFHGRMTSSQEPYDMYAMTAAHKTLPLPTYVRVRNLGNNRNIIVRVNDRGPFVDNRLIDLSYSAAVKLDMIRDGTSLVEVTAISFDKPLRGAFRASKPRPGQATQVDGSLFVQVGAFGEVNNARRRYSLLRDKGIGPLKIYADKRAPATLYRVRIGPIADVIQYDSIVEELQRLGITETHLITE